MLIETSATGPTTWSNVAVLLVRSGSAVFEVTVAASWIVCPAVPAATVPVIVICTGEAAVVERRIRAHDRPAGPRGKRAGESRTGGGASP